MPHRSLRRFLIVAFVPLIALFMMFTQPIPTLAGGCASFPVTIPAGNHTELILAMNCANSTPAHDVINLAPASTYTLTVIFSEDTGLPPIDSDSGGLTINGNGSTITRSSAGGTPEFRLFFVHPGTNLTLDRVSVTNGRLNPHGGALRNDRGTVTITNSTFQSNFSGEGGGAFVNVNGGTLTFRNSLAAFNSAPRGGAFENASGQINIINSTVTGNTATDEGGGAVDNYDTFWSTRVRVINSTIVNNSAPAAPATSGLWIEGGYLEIQNSIVANNSGTNNCKVPVSGARVDDNGKNIDNGDSCDFGVNSLSNTNPLIAALANNGGFTQTHALQVGSPAVNAGSNALAVDESNNPLATDQRGTGFPRIIGTSVDIGAHELTCTGSPYTIPASDTAALIAAINCANASAGNEVINLASASTYTLTAAYAGSIGLPPIASVLTAGTLTINGNGSTITRSSAGGTPEFRLIQMNAGANLTLNNLRLTNGHGGSSAGGAIVNGGGLLRLAGSTVDGNRAGSGGAIYNASASVTTLRDSTLSNNVATNYGGGIDNFNGQVFAYNSTISGNSANGTGSTGGGGAIDSYGASSVLRFWNSTITNNTAPAQTARSGIWQEAGQAFFNNTIVAGNNGTNNCAFTGGTRSENGSNLDNGTSCAFSGTVGQNSNPMLGALANNGGATQTHALGFASPAINRGNNADAVEDATPLATDQRGTGFPRIVLGQVDIGAFELQCPTFPATIAAGDTANLIFAINCANSTTANDVINLASASTYTLTAVYHFDTGLPSIPATATAGTLTINGNGSTITRSSAGGTPNFRHFRLTNGANLTLNRVTLTNGNAPIGGAIENNEGTLIVTNSSITNNSAFGGGGIGTVTSGTVRLTNSLIANNTVTGFGGGMLIPAGTYSIVNSTISGNSAAGDGGGAMDIFNSPTVTIINSTITNNTAAANPTRSGIWHKGSTLTIQNSIVAGNNGTNNCVGTITDGGKNIDNGTSCGFGANSFPSTNPLINALANNGGFTFTHALQIGSPAINAGSNALAVDHLSAALTTDQRGTGFPRISAGIVDIGAYELQCPSFPATIAASDTAGLILAIGCANATTANDVINLTAGSTYALTAVIDNSVGATGLPPIFPAGTAGTLTINGNGATITRSGVGGTPDFRILRLTSAANLTLNQIRLTNGRLPLGGGGGGGIRNEGGTLMLTGVTVDLNTSSAGGGILNGPASTTTLRDSTVSNNTATGFSYSYGGGIANVQATLRVINSTISGNSANATGGTGGGGALDIANSSSVMIINSTITNNSAAAPNAARSGIWLEDSTLTIQNSIVAGNNGANNCAIAVGAVVNGGNNLDNGTSCGFGGAVGQNANPNLAPLANNGGPTFTHALQLGSPAINAGSNALAVDHTGAALTTDQRGTGFPRISAGIVDIGAYELQCPTFPATIAASDTAGLILAIGCANATTANDVINLTAGSTYTLTAVNDNSAGETGLPPIFPAGTAGTLTINGNGATITRSSAGGTPDFRIFLLKVGSNLTLNQVRLTNGRALTIGGGGAIYNDGGTLMLTGVTIDLNTSGAGGGIHNRPGSTTTLRDSTVSNNTATGALFSYGGGIANVQATLRVINSTISGNSANGTTADYGGGAIYSSLVPANVLIVNSTITNNTAIAPNAAASGIKQVSGTMTIQNSIIANNNGANNCLIAGGTVVDGGKNIDNGTSCGFGANSFSNTNPLINALANNGGFTFTHALQFGSPAINAGSNALAVDYTGAALTLDQRGTGFPRINVGTVDIGAYEAACPTFPYTVPASNSALLIYAISCANSTTANDVINLTAGSTYTLTAVNDNSVGATGLPSIFPAGTAGTLTINGNGATITRSSTGGTPDFRIIRMNRGSNLTLNQVRLTNGREIVLGGGGGIYNDGGTLMLTGVTVDLNTSLVGGGIHNAQFSTMTLRDSTVSNNTATGFTSSAGGGIASVESTLRVINSTISGNTALGTDTFGGGGAIFSYGTANVLIVNSTITNNTAAAPNAARSGIWLAVSTLTIQNSIVAGNNGTNNCLIAGGTVVDGGKNIDNGTSCGFGANSFSNANANLAPLANNGGFTFTHALLPGSAAINAGSNALAVDHLGAALTLDQRGTGFPRINSGTVDIGAFEATVNSLAVSLYLQGRGSMPTPHAAWVITVHVTVMPQGGGTPYFTKDFVTDMSGNFNILNLPAGTYLFRFKGTHTLARQVEITIPGTGTLLTEPPILLEGDANDDNAVTLVDFSLLAASFSRAQGQIGFDARADFNQDNIVNLIDFSLLASNFNKAGDGGINP